MHKCNSIIMNSFHILLIFSLYAYMFLWLFLIKGSLWSRVWGRGSFLKKRTKTNKGRAVKPISMFTTICYKFSLLKGRKHFTDIYYLKLFLLLSYIYIYIYIYYIYIYIYLCKKHRHILCWVFFLKNFFLFFHSPIFINIEILFLRWGAITH